LERTWAEADEQQRTAWLRTGIVPLDYPDPVAADWPELLAIVEEKVKPEHLAQKDKFGQEYWWHFLRARSELQSAIAGAGEGTGCFAGWARFFASSLLGAVRTLCAKIGFTQLRQFRASLS